MDNNCIFCKIINNEIPSKKVFENDYVLAFEDINPVTPIHILVIPKKHIESLENLSEEDNVYITNIHKAMKEISKKLGFNESGYRVIVNCGKDSGQEVMHLHYHILAGTKLGAKIV